jgi:hypothetical protein
MSTKRLSLTTPTGRIHHLWVKIDYSTSKLASVDIKQRSMPAKLWSQTPKLSRTTERKCEWLKCKRKCKRKWRPRMLPTPHFRSLRLLAIPSCFTTRLRRLTSLHQLHVRSLGAFDVVSRFSTCQCTSLSIDSRDRFFVFPYSHFRIHPTVGIYHCNASISLLSLDFRYSSFSLYNCPIQCLLG